MPTKPNTPAPSRNPLVLIGLATVAVLLIVIGPFLMVHDATRQSLAAAAMVNHTYEVGSTINALMYVLSLYFQDPSTLDMTPFEAGLATLPATVGLAKGIPPPVEMLVRV